MSVQSWRELLPYTIYTSSSDCPTEPLFSPAVSETSSEADVEYLEDHFKHESVKKAVLIYIDAFKSTSQSFHIHPLAKLAETPRAAKAMVEWDKSIFELLFAAARTRFTPHEAHSVLLATGAKENFPPVVEATLKLYQEEYNGISFSEQVPKETERFLIELIYCYVCEGSATEKEL